jgi:hypothetical protein
LEPEIVELRRAIESLRAGVPNRDVVRHIEPDQEDVSQRFDAMLEAAQAGSREDRAAAGLLIEGEFGAGKSHWLEYFQHVALQGNFICSTIVLNKETPLHDLAKVFQAAVESAVAPGKVGPALQEVTHSYHADTAPGFHDLFEWAHRAPNLDPRFRATLLLFEKTRDPALRQQIVDEWMGHPIPVPDLRHALSDLGERTGYPVTRALKGQTLQRLQFLARFFLSAGYNGWVLLIDETEMVSRYSFRQRARAYAHLAQLMGLDRAASAPGVAAVFTITKDYAGQVLLGKKNDSENIPARLQETALRDFIPAAELGMKAIRNRGLDLRPPSRNQVTEIYQKVRSLYSRAYRWPAPELESRREHSSSTSMRQHIRSWITAWDLRRLYDYTADLVSETVSQSYEEDKDLQSESAPAASEDQVGSSARSAHLDQGPVRVL